MEKVYFVKFIEKYSLGDLISTVLVRSKSGNVFVEFVSGDKTVKGAVHMKDFAGFEDNEFGIFDTQKLKKMLDVLSDNVSIDYDFKSENVINSIYFSDKKMKMKFVACEKNIIAKVPKINTEPKYDIIIDFDETFIDMFVKANTAIDTEIVTVLVKDNNVKFVLGHVEKHNTNTITLNTDINTDENIEPVTISSTNLAEVLKANRDLETGSIKISQEGLVKVQCSNKKYNSEYYIVAIRGL